MWWLLRKPLCGLTDLVISESASQNPVQTGQPLTYTLTVQRSGECEGTGVTVTDVLPPGVTFVSAETPQGTWTEADGVVTFHLGALEEVFVQLSVTVTPTQPGSITNTVRVRGNESEQSLGNNSASLTLQVQGRSITTQSLTRLGPAHGAIALSRMTDGQLLIAVTSDLGLSWTLDTSEDLVHWTVRTAFTAAAPVTQFVEQLDSRVSFLSSPVGLATRRIDFNGARPTHFQCGRPHLSTNLDWLR